jgi:predicted Zn finger-like uncharacterized protein
MSIKTICPECQTTYQLADQQAGKKVRCKQCQTIFMAVEASPRRTAVAKPSTTTIRRRSDPDEENEPQPVPVQSVAKKNALPWLLGGIAAVFGILLLLCGALIAYLLMAPEKAVQVANMNAPPPAAAVAPPPQPFQPVHPPAADVPMQGVGAKKEMSLSQADNPPAQGQLVEPSKPSQAVADIAKPNGEPKKEPPPELVLGNKGRITAEGRERVKRATVYLRVKMADGTQGSGSGFFGCKEAPNIILTNAHVVGMLAPESARPESVEVVVNSGEANEWKTSARVLGVDRASDLAVLDIGTPPQPTPEPLPVKPAGGLQALDEVYVFGFPFGEALGKEITIRPASVSALRKNPKTGLLERVQVNGGIDPGNSGGPVVDNSGAVVGVAVAVWAASRQIASAIPGERVQTILNGRISDLVVQQPYFTDDNKVAVPIVIDMIDPRSLIKEVGLEIWTGDKPADTKAANRPAATPPPPAQPGDSRHLYYKMKYLAPEGKAEIVLPELPPGKAYWQQAKWVDSKGQTYWAAAAPMKLPSAPVYRRPANLVLRYTQGAKRSLDLTIENIFKVSNNDDDSDAFRVRTTAQFTETVVSTGAGGTQLSLRYKFPPSRELLLPDGKSASSGTLEQIKDDLTNLVTNVQLDRLGNITRQTISLPPSRHNLQAMRSAQHLRLMKEFQEMIQQGLESLSVSLPSAGTAKPMESWRAERHLPIDTPGKTETGKIDVTFTYLGTRKRDGREEAVIRMDGLVRGKEDAIGGKADGFILVDLASGQTLLADTNVKLQLKALLSRPGEPLREARVVATMKFHMQRKM